MTFIRPPPGAGFCMAGSTLLGGQITPFELASLSLRFGPESPLPTVPPLPPLGAHGAFVAGPGGGVGVVCAAATPVARSRRAAEIAEYGCMCASR